MEQAATVKKQHRSLSVRRKLLFSSAAIVIALLFLEAAIRVVRPGFPGFSSPQVEHRPASDVGFELVPGQQAYSLSAPVSINSAGYRGPELRTERGPDALRIACLGDSFTFGFGVADDQTFPRQLEQILQEAYPVREIEVINAGVEGYATYHEIDVLKLRILPLKPDVVILAVYLNDLHIRPDPSENSKYVEEYARAQSLQGRVAKRLGSVLNKSALYTLGKNLVQARRYRGGYLALVSAASSSQDSPTWQAMENELRTFGMLAREHKFLGLVVTIPPKFQIVGEGAQLQYPKNVLNICQDLGLDSYDLTPTLKGWTGPQHELFLGWDNHFSSTGNQLIAAAIRDALVSRNVFAKPPRGNVTNN